MSVRLLAGDCLEVMPTLPAGSVDMICADLPYGTTACKWDAIIPLDRLWPLYRRLLSPRGAIVLTATQPFTTNLIASNYDGFCYSWVWNKRFSGNFVQAKRMPLRTCEDVLVFSLDGRMPTYHPQMMTREVPIKQGSTRKAQAIPIKGPAADAQIQGGRIYDTKFPVSLLEFSSRSDRGAHPTQKPVALFEYLVRTYTDEGDTVLDNTMGSGSTGVACVNTGRSFIGIERDPTYFAIAAKRIAEAEAPAMDTPPLLAAMAAE